MGSVSATVGVIGEYVLRRGQNAELWLGMLNLTEGFCIVGLNTCGSKGFSLLKLKTEENKPGIQVWAFWELSEWRHWNLASSTVLTFSQPSGGSRTNKHLARFGDSASLSEKILFLYSTSIIWGNRNKLTVLSGNFQLDEGIRASVRLYFVSWT